MEEIAVNGSAEKREINNISNNSAFMSHPVLNYFI
jgi:hypothetical protein